LYLPPWAEELEGQKIDDVHATEMARKSKGSGPVSRSEDNQWKFLVGGLPKNDSEKRTDRRPGKGRLRLIVAVFS
jgi:hypothetical protein